MFLSFVCILMYLFTFTVNTQRVKFDIWCVLISLYIFSQRTQKTLFDFSGKFQRVISHAGHRGAAGSSVPTIPRWNSPASAVLLRKSNIIPSWMFRNFCVWFYLPQTAVDAVYFLHDCGGFTCLRGSWRTWGISDWSWNNNDHFMHNFKIKFNYTVQVAAPVLQGKLSSRDYNGTWQQL